jgi:hypothetical protein
MNQSEEQREGKVSSWLSVRSCQLRHTSYARFVIVSVDIEDLVDPHRRHGC